MKKQLKNTNITLQGGEYIVLLTNNEAGYGERTMLITNSIKTIKQYTNAGYFIFGSPDYYREGLFFALTKSLKNKTKNKKLIVIDNAIFHINKHIERGNPIKYEVQPFYSIQN